MSCSFEEPGGWMGMGCMGGSITDAMLYLCEVSVTRLSREADMSADDA